FTHSFWPQPFSADFVASFFNDFIGYVSKAAESSPDLADEVAGFTGEVVLSAFSEKNSVVARAFLIALSQNFLPISSSDADKLVTSLIEQFAAPIVLNAGNSENSSSQSNGSPTSSGAASKSAGDDATASTASSKGS
ncbi:phosphatidylinositol 4-kinase alpha-like, partial [Trifolium medium]|nr:phosphatidylinositol 4-kinase alpha-like [Trifolium medium]